MFLQWRAGAFRVEFGSHPDEAAHYVTGLMIRDYIASGHFAHPVAYAEHYYEHYPKVAIGMWPPLFHVVEALWMLCFSPAKASVLALLALIAALTALSIYFVLRRDYPMPVALVTGLLYLLLPLTQLCTSAVMADGLVALLDLWAMIFLVRYIDRAETRDAVIYGFCAALSMSTKANGVATVLLPLFALPLAGRMRLLRARGLYYAAGIVLLLGFPWQVLSYRLIAQSQGVASASVPAMLSSFVVYGYVLWQALGWGLVPFLLLGIGCLGICLRNGPPLRLVGALALLLSVWIYHSALANPDRRYMLAALPPALILATAGFSWVVRRFPVPAPRPAVAFAFGVVAAVLFVARTWAIPLKPYQGFDQPARLVLSSPDFANGDALIISGALGEGAFISEVAMHDDRPDHVVLRSTKVLSSQTWYGTIYELRYQNSAQIRDFLDRAPIDAVLLDTRRPDIWQVEGHADLQQKVLAALTDDPHWRHRDSFPKGPGLSPWIDFYSRVGAPPAGQVRLDLRYTLGKQILHSRCTRAHGIGGQ